MEEPCRHPNEEDDVKLDIISQESQGRATLHASHPNPHLNGAQQSDTRGHILLAL